MAGVLSGTGCFRGAAATGRAATGARAAMVQAILCDGGVLEAGGRSDRRAGQAGARGRGRLGAQPGSSPHARCTHAYHAAGRRPPIWGRQWAPDAPGGPPEKAGAGAGCRRPAAAARRARRSRRLARRGAAAPAARPLGASSPSAAVLPHKPRRISRGAGCWAAGAAGAAPPRCRHPPWCPSLLTGTTQPIQGPRQCAGAVGPGGGVRARG